MEETLQKDFYLWIYLPIHTYPFIKLTLISVQLAQNLNDPRRRLLNNTVPACFRGATRYHAPASSRRRRQCRLPPPWTTPRLSSPRSWLVGVYLRHAATSTDYFVRPSILTVLSAHLTSEFLYLNPFLLKPYLPTSPQSLICFPSVTLFLYLNRAFYIINVYG